MGKPGLQTVVVLFTRDLRVHDHPALAAAVDRAERVVPLFVLDDAVLGAFGAPNRVASSSTRSATWTTRCAGAAARSSSAAATWSPRRTGSRSRRAQRPSSSART
jgi:hypothetical protein